MMVGIGRFRLGVTSFFDGVKLLKKDRTVQTLGLVPAVMSLTLFTVGLIFGMMYIDEVMSWTIKSNLNDYNVYMKSLIYILSFVLLCFILYFFTFIVVSILAIPICATLSQRVLLQSGYLLPKKKSLSENAYTFLGMLRISILKLGFILIISVMLFVASFLPVLAPLAVYLSLMILTFDCMDYAMEHDEQTLKQRFQFLFSHWIEFSGFALCMAMILAIPFIHFILLPAAVLGTSVLYTKIQIKNKDKYDSKFNS